MPYRETGAIFRHQRLHGSVGGQIVEYPGDKRVKGNGDGRQHKEIPTYHDSGCYLSKSCLNCSISSLCEDCTEPLASCAICKILLKCPMFSLNNESISN
jgi:hypothetical protein